MTTTWKSKKPKVGDTVSYHPNQPKDCWRDYGIVTGYDVESNGWAIVAWKGARQGAITFENPDNLVVWEPESE